MGGISLFYSFGKPKRDSKFPCKNILVAEFAQALGWGKGAGEEEGDPVIIDIMQILPQIVS